MLYLLRVAETSARQDTLYSHTHRRPTVTESAAFQLMTHHALSTLRFFVRTAGPRSSVRPWSTAATAAAQGTNAEPPVKLRTLSYKLRLAQLVAS